MEKRCISVGELQFGMYIVELDRPWTETPFMFQGFYLRTERQLQALRKFCRQVFVHVPPGAARSSGRQVPQLAAPAIATMLHVGGGAAYPAETPLEREVDVATGLYAQTAKRLHEAFAPLAKASTALDATALAQSVKALAESVVRNPDALLLVSKKRDASVRAHARAAQVAIYMMVFARFLRLDREQMYLLGLLGLVQDVGKLRLPDGADEETLKKHVELSTHILGVTSGLPAKLPSLALLHHERQDGMGYPRGLKGYQIGLNGSIAAICDRYDELVAPPPHGEGRSPSAAVNLLLNERGTAFHGPLVEQFIRCMGSFPVGSLVELSSGEIAVVIGENAMQRLKPKVMLVRHPEHKIVDLAAKGGDAYRIRRSLDQRALGFDPRRLFS